MDLARILYLLAALAAIAGALRQLLPLLVQSVKKVCPRFVRCLKRAGRWIKAFLVRRMPSTDFPFDVLNGTSELRHWLAKNQRLTLIGNYRMRGHLTVGQEVRRRILIRAGADIGKTREALSIIEAWVDHHRIHHNVVVLVPKNPYSIPDFSALPFDKIDEVGSRNLVMLLDDVPQLCKDPGIGEASHRLRCMVDQFELDNWSTLLIVATGRTHALQQSLGRDYRESAFPDFEVSDVQDFSPSELETVIIYVASTKCIDVRHVVRHIGDACGTSSAENIVQFLDKCRLHAALSEPIGWWARTFGTPLTIKGQAAVTSDLVRLLTTSSATTWRNVVYVAAARNYPEMAALYRAVTVLACLGIRAYAELVVCLASSLAPVRPLRRCRVERALRFLMDKGLDFAIDDGGRISCPDVVYAGVDLGDQTRLVRAAARNVARFSESSAATAGASGLRRALLYGVGCGGVVVSLLAINLLTSWLFPAVRMANTVLRPLALVCAVLPLFLAGAEFRADEIRRAVFFWVSLPTAYLAYLYLVLGSELLGATLALVLAFSTFLAAGVWLVTGGIYRAMGVWEHLSPRPTTLGELKRLLRELAFRSPDRVRIWIGPLTRRGGHSWLWIFLLTIVSLIGSVAVARISFYLWDGPFVRLPLLVSAVCLLMIARPHRFGHESLLAIGLVNLAWCGPMIRAMHWRNVGAVWFGQVIVVWFLCVVLNVILVAYNGRRDAASGLAELSPGEPIYPSQRRGRPLTISSRALVALCVLGAVGVTIPTVRLFRRGIDLFSVSGGMELAERRFARRVWANLERLFPSSGPLQYRLGGAYFLEGEYRESARHLALATRLGGARHSDVLRLLAVAAFWGGQDRIAMDAARAGLRMDSAQADLEVLEGAVLFQAREYENSVRVGRELVLKRPQYSGAWGYLASSVIELGRCSLLNEVVGSLSREPEGSRLAMARCKWATGDVVTSVEIYSQLAQRVGGELGVRLSAQEHLRIIKGQDGRLVRKGALVYSVVAYTSGSRGGLRRGDVLIAIEGLEIRCRDDAIRLRNAFASRAFITWGVVRGGKRIEIRTQPGCLGVLLLDF